MRDFMARFQVISCMLALSWNADIARIDEFAADGPDGVE
jgi:hypothetical protein